MNISTMRKIDRCVGIPACFLLTLCRIIRDIFRPARLCHAGVQRIVFVKLAEQGATILAYPTIKKAVEKVGAGNVYFLVFESNRFILDALKIIPERNVITISSKGIFSISIGTIKAIWRMRKKKIDTAIDLEFFARSSAVLCYLSGAKWRVGLHAFAGEASYRGNLMTHRLSYNPHLHAADTFSAMLKSLKISPKELPSLNFKPNSFKEITPQFSSHQNEVDEVKNIILKEIDRNNIPDLILLNPNASDLLPIRCWPNQRYIHLARRLIDRYPEIYIVFTGGPEEAIKTEHLVSAVMSERCISLAGKTTLRHLLILYTLAEVLVTNDSGPAQFAAMTEIDSIVLFGPETPKLFAPLSPKSHIIWAGIACSPCVNAYNDRQSPCRNNVCMREITIDMVFSKTSQVYENRQRAALQRPMTTEQIF